MPIITTIDTASEFRDCFVRMGRGNQFSYNGFEALYDHLEDYSDSTGEPFELDVVAICCDYSEYNDIDEFLFDSGNDDPEDLPDFEDMDKQEILNYVSDYGYGVVIDIPGTDGFIVCG